MSKVEVPDWPVPMPEAGRRKLERQGLTHRDLLKTFLEDATSGLAEHDDLLALARASTLIDELIAEEVARRRADDPPYSWAEIGNSLGMSRQAAQQRYGVKER